MTTIAIDAFGNIAADGRVTSGNEIIRDDNVKLTVRHGRIHALTGCPSLRDALIEWYHAGAVTSDLPIYSGDKGWGFIVIRAEGLFFYTNNVPHALPNEFKTPAAFGSGQQWAMGAMMAGKTAKEAVEIACKVDNGSGGQVISMNIADTLSMKLKEAAE